MRIALAALSALAAAAVFPPLGWWPLALVAWIPLWFALHGAGARLGFRLGLLHGLVLYAITLFWFWSIFGAIAMGLWLVLAAFAGAAGAWFGAASFAWPRAWWLPWLATTVWTGVEFFRSEWFSLSFSWITPGLGIGPTWLSPWLGCTGATFLLMLAACGWACRAKSSKLAAVAATAAAVVLCLWRPGPVPLDPARAIPVLAVQSEALDFSTYLQLTRESGFRDGTVVWPEYAALFFAGPTARPWGEAEDLCRENNLTLVLGTVRYSSPPGATRKFNEALVLNGGGILGSHVKNRPVHLMDDGEKGTTALPVATPAGTIGTPVCFDCDAMHVTRAMTASGAEWFAVPSMDAKHWGQAQHRQHADVMRHRAAENQRWMVVAATSGVTWILDSHGLPGESLPGTGDGVLRGRVMAESDLTFFTRFGHWFGPATCLAAALALAATMAVLRKSGARSALVGCKSPAA